jgi:iron complex outermembrane receptor protein
MTQRIQAAALILSFVFLTPRIAPCQPPAAVSAVAQDLKRLSIEELAQIDVTSVSRRAEKLADTAAAVSVINSNEIYRSGVTTLAETLRLADAIDVARVNSSTWATSLRGFTTNPANKLLVLMDGRSVYSPLTSGTFWDAQDTLLADIERIEVIRGPGGAVWGANAVNGVINVISKDASSTIGDYVSVAAGSDEHVSAAARHGGRVGTGAYRIYGKYRQHGAQLFTSTGQSAGDPVQMGQAGFRVDSGRQGAATWFVEGGGYRGTNGFSDRPDGDIAGGDVLGRWTRAVSGSAVFQAQVYYDGTYRKVPLQFTETRHTVDADVQHRFKAGQRHDLIVGGGARFTRGNDVGIAGFFFEPEVRSNSLFNLMAQDEIAVKRNRFYLIVGAKLERNDFTGFELQPTVRGRWTPTPHQTAWAAVSRAVRLPTRLDTDLRLIDPTTRRLTLTGSDDFKPEEVVAYEAGYRIRPLPMLSLDVAAFTNRYDELRSTELTFTPLPLIVLENRLNARTRGVELAGTLQPLPAWRVHGSYAYFHRNFTFDPGSRDVYHGAVEGNDPSHLMSLRSSIDLPMNLALDLFLRRTGERPDPLVKPYGELDLRLGWTARAGWDLSLVGQNLLHARHSELLPLNAPHYDFRRGVFVRSRWYF